MDARLLRSLTALSLLLFLAFSGYAAWLYLNMPAEEPKPPGTLSDADAKAIARGDYVSVDETIERNRTFSLPQRSDYSQILSFLFFAVAIPVSLWIAAFIGRWIWTGQLRTKSDKNTEKAS
jgi:hypothetical protein